MKFQKTVTANNSINLFNNSHTANFGNDIINIHIIIIYIAVLVNVNNISVSTTPYGERASCITSSKLQNAHLLPCS